MQSVHLLIRSQTDVMDDVRVLRCLLGDPVSKASSASLFLSVYMCCHIALRFEPVFVFSFFFFFYTLHLIQSSLQHMEDVHAVQLFL